MALPSYRGDLVDRSGFTEQDRRANPDLLLRGYERAALTLNYLRALADGGFADLHHPENWRLDFVRNPTLSSEYEAIVGSVREALRFLETIADSDTSTRRIDLVHQPRSSDLALRAGANAPTDNPSRLVQSFHPHALGRHAYGPTRWRSHRVCARHPQSNWGKDWLQYDARVAYGTPAHVEPSERAWTAHTDPPVWCR